MRLLLMALALAAVTACATPSPPPADAYGPPPADYDATVRAFLQTHLRDPMSAQIAYVVGPRPRWQSLLGQTDAGWGVCYRVNARNAYGGYVGERLYYFIINNDRVANVFYDDGAGSYSIAGRIAERSCAEMAAP